MATLKSLVDETTVIKNELKSCHTNLKNNLIAKGVVCSGSDKVSDLVNKINKITSISSVVCGDNYIERVDNNVYYPNSTYVSVEKMPLIVSYTNFKFKGNYRLSIPFYGSGSTTWMFVYHKRGSETVKVVENSSGANGVTVVIDLIDVRKDDIIEIKACKNQSSSNNNIKGISFRCDFVFSCGGEICKV